MPDVNTELLFNISYTLKAISASHLMEDAASHDYENFSRSGLGKTPASSVLYSILLDGRVNVLERETDGNGMADSH